MNFYTHQHQYYCGIDLQAKSMYLSGIYENAQKIASLNKFLMQTSV